jgi:hypothetical protein
MMAVVIDLIYQAIELRGLRPVQAVFVGVLLGVLPYVVLCGLINRVARIQQKKTLKQAARCLTCCPKQSYVGRFDSKLGLTKLSLAVLFFKHPIADFYPSNSSVTRRPSVSSLSSDCPV